MKKVVNITVGGVVFVVEEDAYEILSDYLESIAQYLAKDSDRDEIVTDIEASIAEKFAGGRKANAVVSKKDVEKMIEAMGSIKDFKQFAEEEEDEDVVDEALPLAKRKLYRDMDDSIIGGVASGLAAYLGVDTVIMRIVFFVTLFFGGFGFVLYVLMWVIVPPALTTAQRLQMRGERITLKEIEKSVKNGVDKLKKKDLRIFSRLEVVLKRVFELLFKVVRVFAGVILILLAVVGIFALSFAIVWIISGADIPYSEYVLRDFLLVSDFVFAIFNFALYYVLLFPLIVSGALGLSILRKKYVVSGGMMIFLAIVWFAALGFLGSIVLQNLEHIEETVRLIQLEENLGA